jgi:hypothetical protein
MSHPITVRNWDDALAQDGCLVRRSGSRMSMLLGLLASTYIHVYMNLCILRLGYFDKGGTTCMGSTLVLLYLHAYLQASHVRFSECMSTLDVLHI